MKGCKFCEIVSGKRTCFKLYENDFFLAFLDIFPVSKGHTLVIPKKHFRWVYDVPNFSEYWNFALHTTKLIQKGLCPKWIQYITHGLLPHAHIHIIPRFEPIEIAPSVPPENTNKLASEDELKRISALITKL